MRERFYVRELIGIPIHVGRGRGGSSPVASYYVMDRLVNCQVVATFDQACTPYSTRRDRMRRRAERHAAKLNKEWKVECKTSSYPT